MNNVTLIGRFTKDPEIKYTNEGLSIARFTLAVDRRFKTKDEKTADFPNCVAFGKTAEFIERYFRKGAKIGVTGRIQTGSYEKQDGTKVYTTDVVVENAEFVERKQEEPIAPPVDNETDFMDVPPGAEDNLPFK